MKWKWTLPYIIAGATLMADPGLTTAQNEHETDTMPNDVYAQMHTNSQHYSIIKEAQKNEKCLDSKADSLRDMYVSNMLESQQKLKPLMGRNGYRAAVRAELPGAPVGKHCVWGQYTHLSRALTEMGDTLTIIPDGARTACTSFKYHMDKKYNTPEFANCIHNGVMHESDSAYNVALDRYLQRNKIQTNSPDSVRTEYMKKFAKRNFSADGLDSGSILIVPRYRGSRNQFHAIMYLGRGRIENGKFIPDNTGRHIYVGHNRENIGDIFKTYDTSNIFAANTREIVRAEYANELKRIEAMNYDELIELLKTDNMSELVLNTYPHQALVNMARDKYFNIDVPDRYLPYAPTVALSSTMQPLHINLKMIQTLKQTQKTL